VREKKKTKETAVEKIFRHENKKRSLILPSRKNLGKERVVKTNEGKKEKRGA